MTFGVVMTEPSSLLIAFASWEDRFVEGVLQDLNEIDCPQLLVFYFSDYCDRTESGRNTIQKECSKRSICYEEVSLDSTGIENNLRCLDAAIRKVDDTLPIVIDISTMPREIIWHIFWLCEFRKGPSLYRYYSPEKYSENWLSRNPSRPRLVHKLSGVASPQLKTVLLLAVGYDFQRVSQLISFFEPSKSLLALQADSPFPGNEPSMGRYVNDLRGGEQIKTFPIDAYDAEHGYSAVEQQLEGVVEENNVIIGSLGPKLTAVSLYRIRQKWPQISLVYAPAKEFNRDYSHGIGRLYEGTVKT